MTDTEYEAAKADAYRSAFNDLAAAMSFCLSDWKRKQEIARIESELSAKLKTLRETA